MPKVSKNKASSEKIAELKKCILDESYINHAIAKLAADLTHQLTK